MKRNYIKISIKLFAYIFFLSNKVTFGFFDGFEGEMVFTRVPVCATVYEHPRFATDWSFVILASENKYEECRGWALKVYDGDQYSDLSVVNMRNKPYGFANYPTTADNTISSIIVSNNPNCPKARLIVYLDKYFQGASKTLPPGVYDKEQIESWNNGIFYNSISSLACSCK